MRSFSFSFEETNKIWQQNENADKKESKFQNIQNQITNLPWAMIFLFNLIYYQEKKRTQKKLRTTDQPNKNLIHLHV